jgi:hypothetical protein
MAMMTIPETTPATERREISQLLSFVVCDIEESINIFL